MNQETVYQAPAIVFESTLTTRAGTPQLPRGGETDLFSED